jgi:hypothetical protein
MNEQCEFLIMKLPLAMILTVSCVLALGTVDAADKGRDLPLEKASPERTPLNEKSLADKVRDLKQPGNPAEKLRRAQQWVVASYFTSQQVKQIAGCLGDDQSRLDFATSAFPRTIDPENFYEVYDAFATFSKMMRLHDRVAQMRQSPMVATPVVGPQPVSEADQRDLIRALRRESFDAQRLNLFRQVITQSQRNYLSRQIKEMLACFDFENTRLEAAKLAYDYVLDQDRFFLVGDVFSFDNNRDALRRHIEARRQHQGQH